MLPNYCLNVGFRRGACHLAAPEWVKLCPPKRCVGGWTQVQGVRTMGSRCLLGPHLPVWTLRALYRDPPAGLPSSTKYAAPAIGVGRKHRTSVKTHVQSEEITLFVGSSRALDEDEDDHTNIMYISGFPDGASGKEFACSAGDTEM